MSQPQQTPLEEQTPTPEDWAGEPETAAVDAPQGEVVVAGQPLLSLRDTQSGRVAVVHGLPATIGRGAECDVALEGAGTEAVYARLMEEEYGLVLEQLRPGTRVAVNRDHVDRAVLTNGDALYIDDRAFTLDWHSVGAGEQPGRTRNRRLLSWIGFGAIGLAVLIVGGAIALRYFGPPVEAPTKEDVPALDVEKSRELNPLDFNGKK